MVKIPRHRPPCAFGHSTAAAADAAGDFVITWWSSGQDGGGWGVYARRFSHTGAAQGPEFRVNTTTAGDQKYSSVAMDGSCNFMITWSSYGQDGGGWGVYGQQYGAAGQRIGQPAPVVDLADDPVTVRPDPQGARATAVHHAVGGQFRHRQHQILSAVLREAQPAGLADREGAGLGERVGVERQGGGAGRMGERLVVAGDDTVGVVDQ